MRPNRIQHFVFALPITLLLGLVSCEDQGNQVQLSYSTSIEDHSTSYSFPSGVYYSLVFPQPYSHEFDVNGIFRRVANAGIRSTDAWYKNYNTGCHPPGSIVVLPAEVEPVLLIRTDEATPTLEQLGFVQTQNPSTGSCNYTVKRYVFHN